MTTKPPVEHDRLPSGVTRPIPGELLRLAMPVLASHLLYLAYQWVDAVWVRGLGVNATAAVTTSMFVVWGVLALSEVFSMGASAFVSQMLGAGERRRAGLAAFKALRGAATMGLLCTAAGLLFARSIYGLMTSDPGVLDSGESYLSVLLMFAPLLMLARTSESIMRSAGDTRTPLLIDFFAIGLNAILDPLLIYGWGPFPRLEVVGAAWATVISQIVMVGCYAGLALRGHRAFPLATKAPGPPVRTLGMVRVGLPVALITILFSAVYIAFARSAAAFGAASLAIVGVANRIEGLQFVTSVAIGSAGAALVGQNLGANRPDRAVQVLKTGNLWGAAIAGVLMVLYLVFPEVFLSLFTEDPEVMRIGVPYLRIISLCVIINSVEIVTAESIIGSGHTAVMSWIFTIFSVVRIPLAFLVPAWTGTGIIGIAWLITVTCIVRGLIIAGWAARGTWKTGLARELRPSQVPAPEPGESA